jgi:hypothetical protein
MEPTALDLSYQQDYRLQLAWQELQAVPAYTERYADGREPFPETDVSCQPLVEQEGNGGKQ